MPGIVIFYAAVGSVRQTTPIEVELVDDEGTCLRSATAADPEAAWRIARRWRDCGLGASITEVMVRPAPRPVAPARSRARVELLAQVAAAVVALLLAGRLACALDNDPDGQHDPPHATLHRPHPLPRARRLRRRGTRRLPPSRLRCRQSAATQRRTVPDLPDLLWPVSVPELLSGGSLFAVLHDRSGLRVGARDGTCLHERSLPISVLGRETAASRQRCRVMSRRHLLGVPGRGHLLGHASSAAGLALVSRRPRGGR